MTVRVFVLPPRLIGLEWDKKAAPKKIARYIFVQVPAKLKSWRSSSECGRKMAIWPQTFDFSAEFLLKYCWTRAREIKRSWEKRADMLGAESRTCVYASCGAPAA